MKKPQLTSYSVVKDFNLSPPRSGTHLSTSETDRYKRHSDGKGRNKTFSIHIKHDLIYKNLKGQRYTHISANK